MFDQLLNSIHKWVAEPGEGGGGWVRDGEILPTLTVGLWASVMWGEEAGRFRKVLGVSIVVAGGPCSAIDTLTVDSQCKKRKECFDTRTIRGTRVLKGKSGGNAICWWHTKVFAVNSFFLFIPINLCANSATRYKTESIQIGYQWYDLEKSLCTEKEIKIVREVENVCLQGAGNYGFSRYQVNWVGWKHGRW